MDKPAKENTVIWRPNSKIPQANYNTALVNIFKMAKHIKISRKKTTEPSSMVTEIHSWQIFRMAKWVVKRTKSGEKNYQIRGDYRQIESGERTGPLPLARTPSCCLWALTQGRLQERTKQPGHVCFDRFNLHSFAQRWVFRVRAVAGESSRSSIGERLRALSSVFRRNDRWMGKRNSKAFISRIFYKFMVN